MHPSAHRRQVQLVRWVAVAALVLNASPAWPQLTTGTILGSVTDETGGVLPGAEVTITHIETGVSRTTAANELGRFEAPNLPTGTYEATGTMSGFGTAVR